MSNKLSANDTPPAAVPIETVLFVRDHCLCLHTQRAARAMSRIFDEALRPLGLNSGQFSLLISLNRPEPPTLGSVAQLLALDRTTLTANLKPLERQGLVDVRPDEKDRRTRRLVITSKGRDLLVEAVPVWTSTHQAIETRLASGIPDRLRSDLNALL
jgi:DNA-binding MarR family transcriptional regulator